MNKKKKIQILVGDIVGCALAIIIFIFPFYFMFINSLKDRREANKLSIAFPTSIHWENYLDVLKNNNYQVLIAFKNSFLIMLFAVAVLIIVCSMAGYVVQRRNDKVVNIISTLVMLGLMLPPAILPTIKLLQQLHIYKTMFGIVMIEIALQTPFTLMLYRGFVASVPKELEEAGYIDGCTNFQVFFKIVFPLLKPVSATVIILDAVTIFNDFQNPLYFFNGSKNATVQLTLYNFMGQFASEYNLLFADVIIITIPMLIIFLIFNRKIVDGMVAGAVKG
ncbi:MAG: carbohydrate ABC transporter permease [Lachnospiraceae bacterium]|jgi:raffinose/stachyose/melibiose transport system permease protein|nr:carbohydrate ABC transporter permease [Lachnospiraceae bacterium]